MFSSFRAEKTTETGRCSQRVTRTARKRRLQRILVVRSHTPQERMKFLRILGWKRGETFQVKQRQGLCHPLRNVHVLSISRRFFRCPVLSSFSAFSVPDLFQSIYMCRSVSLCSRLCLIFHDMSHSVHPTLLSHTLETRVQCFSNFMMNRSSPSSLRNPEGRYFMLDQLVQNKYSRKAFP